MYFDIDCVDVVMKPDAVFVSQNDPEHAEGFDAVEDVEDVGFVFEGFEGFSEVEGVEEFHRSGMVVAEFWDAAEVSGDQGEEHEEEDNDNDWVEEPFFLELEVERAVDDVAHKQIGAQFLQNGIECIDDESMPVVVTLLRQAESHIQSSIDSGMVGAFIDHGEGVCEIVGVALIVEAELLDVVAAVEEDLRQVFQDLLLTGTERWNWGEVFDCLVEGHKCIDGAVLL